MPTRLSWLAVVACLLAATHHAAADDWPGWRGGVQDGLTQELSIPLHWSDTENVHWKLDLPGVGHSSPIVWGDAIFVTYANIDSLTRHLVRVDRESGKIVWDRVVTTAPIEPMHRDNTPASTTPITDGAHVFVSFCDDQRLLVAAVDFTGEVAWRVYPGTFEASHGYSTALVLDGNRLFLSGLQDGDDSFVAAIDKQSGATLWKVARRRKIRSYSAPCLCDVGGKQALLLSGAEQTVAYDRLTGETLWEVEGPAEKTVSSIVCSRENRLAFVCGGRDNQLLAISLSEAEQGDGSRVAWRGAKGIPYMTSPLYDQGLLHIMSDDGVYRCYAASSGEVLKEKRVAGAVKASMFANPQRIYITAVDGTTTVIANNAEFEVLADNQLAGTVVASPAVSDGDLVFRTDSQLVLVRDKSLSRKENAAAEADTEVEPPLVCLRTR